VSRVSGCDWYLVSIARTHTEHHILHPLDTVSILYPLYMYLVTDFMHDPSRISRRSRTDPTLVARSSSAPAHTRAARETRAVRRDRETVAAQTPWYVSRFGDASRLPLPARTLRDARGGVRRSQRPPSSPFFYPRPRRRGRSAGRCAPARDRGTIRARRTTREPVGAFARPERDSRNATRSERFR
jgi:hypothetical protein